MDYYVYKLTCAPEVKEAILAHLLGLGFDSFEETSEGWITYMPTDQDNEQIIKVLDESEKKLGFSYACEIAESKNWNEIWESQFHPISIDSFCHVRGTFHKPPEQDFTHELIIQPKMAFGTGHHATTSMMIRQMALINFTNRDVFDFGCGTGILSVLAEKMGALTIYALDNDPIAIENTVEHAVLNSCSRITAVHGDLKILGNARFEIVLANINRKVLSESLTTLYKLIKPGGTLLISGVMVNDYDNFSRKVIQEGFIPVSHLEEDDWICSLFSRADND